MAVPHPVRIVDVDDVALDQVAVAFSTGITMVGSKWNPASVPEWRAGMPLP
jgi:hypothetical protein